MNKTTDDEKKKKKNTENAKRKQVTRTDEYRDSIKERRAGR